MNWRAQVALLHWSEKTGQGITPLAAPSQYTLKTTAIVETRALTLASHAFFNEFPRGFVETPILSPLGALSIAREDQLATLDAALAEAQALVSSIRRIDSAEAIEINPSLDPNYVAAAIFEPAACNIDVHALHGGYTKGPDY